MEEKNETQSAAGSVSDAVFGTSSDAIIEGLHQGILAAQSFSDAPGQEEPGDRNQIVNQQDQQDITNASEDNEHTNPAPTTTSQTTTETAAPMSKAEATAILSETDHLDEAGDSEEGISAKNSEKDKIN